jgi:hypothetical protein
MSGALRTGDFWSKIPTYEHRANCTHCPNELETLDHILTECAHPATRLIWNLVKQKWPDDEHNWPKIHQGHILGCGSIQPNPDNDNEVTTGKKCGIARLKRILLSESAYLIWTLRCERTIEGTTYPRRTITAKWLNQMTTRLNIDRRLALSKKKNLTLRLKLNTPGHQYSTTRTPSQPTGTRI